MMAGTSGFFVTVFNPLRFRPSDCCPSARSSHPRSVSFPQLTPIAKSFRTGLPPQFLRIGSRVLAMRQSLLQKRWSEFRVHPARAALQPDLVVSTAGIRPRPSPGPMDRSGGTSRPAHRSAGRAEPCLHPVLRLPWPGWPVMS